MSCFSRAAYKTSVICAVWHRDPIRLELLRGHASNLASQTVQVDPIYVFDGGDQPPDWLNGHAISVRETLTIYQAWNVALSVVSTPFVMNLNLDDRLAPDAVEILQSEITRSDGFLAGGDWRICYSQHETDITEYCYPTDRLPFVPGWPLSTGTVTRLGSGTGERDTFGPACMWTMRAHLGAPRYPWRFADGQLIRTEADLAWWSLLEYQGKKRVRVRQVIGNYHSHPNEQAEFRGPTNEKQLLLDVGLSLL